MGLLALYVGPDQVMPVMSILATITGFFLIFWNKMMGLVRRLLGMKRSSQTDAASQAPSPGVEPPKQQ